MIGALLLTAVGAALVIWIWRDLQREPAESFDRSPYPTDED